MYATAWRDLSRRPDGFDLVGASSNYDELIALVQDTSPDVVVTDIRMPEARSKHLGPTRTARRPALANGSTASSVVRRTGAQAASNVTEIGISFGGGCFFENGVGTTDGSGMFTLTSFTVN